jgi:hypothetical protein
MAEGRKGGGSPSMAEGRKKDGEASLAAVLAAARVDEETDYVREI